MANILCFDTSAPGVRLLNGTSISNLGGNLHRETGYTLTGSTHARTHLAVQSSDNKVFCLFVDGGIPAVVYEFNADGIKMNITADPSVEDPVIGYTISGQSSGATADIINNYETGDNYILISNITNGPFTSGENIDILGGTSGNTATLTGTPAEDNGGEWIKVFSSNNNSRANGSSSGIHEFRNDGSLGLGFVYYSGSNAVNLVKRQEGGSWTEVGVLGTVGTVFTNYYGSIVNENLLYTSIQRNASGFRNLYIFFVDLLNETLTASTTGHIGGLLSPSLPIHQFQSSIYLFFRNGNAGVIYDITGGTFSVFDSLPTTSGDYAFGAGAFMTAYDDNSFLWVSSTDSATMTVLRYFIASDGSLTRNMFPLGSTELNYNSFWFSGGNPGASNTPVFINSNLEDNVGSQTLTFYVKTSGNTNVFSAYQYNPNTSINGGEVATFSGGNTITYTSDPGLSVGDWIVKESDNVAWYVSSVSGASNEIITVDTAENTQTFENTNSATSKPNEPTSLGSVANSNNVLLPSDQRGGGNYIYTSGELHCELISRSEVVGGERWTFVAYSDDGTTTVNVKGYVQSKRTMQISQTSFVNPSGGSSSLNGNTIENVTADNGVTEYQITWNAVSDGFSSGDQIRRYIEVSI